MLKKLSTRIFLAHRISMRPGKKIVACYICFAFFIQAHSQPADAEKQFREIYAKEMRSFENFDTLSYDVSYTYSNESTPGVLLDSLSGHMDRLNNNYHISLGTTQIIYMDSISISFFKEDKILYLSKPKTKRTMSQIAFPDSIMKFFAGTTFNVLKQNEDTRLSILFPKDQQYKSISILIDEKTGYVKQADYIVKTEQLLQEGKEEGSKSPEGYEPYARVSARFYNYSRSGDFPAGLFDQNTYIIKTNDHIETTNAYREYKIFIGSMNL